MTCYDTGTHKFYLTPRECPSYWEKSGEVLELRYGLVWWYIWIGISVLRNFNGWKK